MIDWNKDFKIFIIHVKGDLKRRSHIEKQLNKVKFNYEYILEGNMEDIDKKILNKYFKGDMKKIQPSTSCALKHIKAYEKIKNSNLKYALILEDDIKLLNNFNDYFKKSIIEIALFLKNQV